VQELKPWQAPAPKLRTTESSDTAGTESPSIPAWVGEDRPAPAVSREGGYSSELVGPLTPSDSDETSDD
jgi:hypothetical protein